jgi:hypothetical protein
MRSVAFAAALACAAAIVTPPSVAVAQKTAQKKGDSFLTGAPFSFKTLREAVGVIYEGRLMEAVERRGIAFTPTAAELDQLKQAGASADLLELVKKKAGGMHKAAAPPAPATGVLGLECAPAECEILINGGSKGQTEKGALEIRQAPGQVVVDFRKPGYEGQQITVPVRSGVRVARSVTLKPTLATQAQIGKAVFAKMFDRLGGKNGLPDAYTIVAAGNARLWPAGGARTEWQAIARLKLAANMAYIEISGAGLRWWNSLRASDSKSDGSGKLKGGPVALEMEKLIRLFRDYQLAMLVNRIQAEKMELYSSSAAPDGSGQYDLRAVGEADTYRFTLGDDGAPVKVVYESKSGLGSGLEVVYADYGPLGKTVYPKTMAIRFADQAQHGIELRFDSVRSVPKLSDREFHR